MGSFMCKRLVVRMPMSIVMLTDSGVVLAKFCWKTILFQSSVSKLLVKGEGKDTFKNAGIQMALRESFFWGGGKPL